METAALLDKYAKMLAELGTDPSPPWGGNSDHAYKRRGQITAQVVDRFADYAIGGIGFEFGHDHLRHLSDPSVSAFPPSLSDDGFDRDKVATLLPPQLARLLSFDFATKAQAVDLLRVDGVAGGRHATVDFGGVEAGVSLHTIRVADRAYAMREAHGRWPDRLLEIGGGHGRFVRDVARCSPKTRIFYSDLPLNLLLTARYLSRMFPG